MHVRKSVLIHLRKNLLNTMFNKVRRKAQMALVPYDMSLSMI